MLRKSIYGLVFLLLHQVHCVLSGLECFLLEFDNLPAKVLQDIIDVFDCEDHAWPSCQSLNLSAVVSHLCQKCLYRRDFITDVHEVIRVTLIKESRCKLLERMYMVLNFGHGYIETLGQGFHFPVQSLD